MIISTPKSLIHFIIILYCGSSHINAQIRSSNNDWVPLEDKIQLQSKVVSKSNTYRLNINQLRARLATIPFENTNENKSIVTADFPSSYGTLKKYNIQQLHTISEGLSKKYPNIKSYIGYEIDHSENTIRFIIDNNGLDAMVKDQKGTYYINNKDTKKEYAIYSKKQRDNKIKEFRCGVTNPIANKSISGKTSPKNTNSQGSLLTFRLAMAATGEYSQYHYQKSKS